MYGTVLFETASSRVAQSQQLVPSLERRPWTIISGECNNCFDPGNRAHMCEIILIKNVINCAGECEIVFLFFIIFFLLNVVDSTIAQCARQYYIS